MRSKLVGAALVAALVPLTGAAPPNAEAGPGLAEGATLTPLPVEQVTVFSDRARIARKGPVKLKPGVVVLRTPDLPGATWVDTVRVSAEGARVLRVETQPVDRERYTIDQVDAWLAELETKADEIGSRGASLQVVRQQLQALSGLTVAPPVAEQHRVGKPLPGLNPGVWTRIQDELGSRRTRLRKEERALELQLRELNKSYGKIERDVNQRDLGGFSDRKVQVVVILETTRAGTGSLSVEYAVPGAFWKPAYDLHFDPDAQTVELQATGRVTQASGEDWDRTKLLLSTAIPGRGIGLPELITWTLGDDREYRPRPSARQGRRGVRAFAPPAPRPRIAELVQQADRQILQSRTNLLVSMASSRGNIYSGMKLGNVDVNQPRFEPPAPPVTVTAPSPVPPKRPGSRRRQEFDFSDDEIEGDLSAPDGEYLEERSMRPQADSAPSAGIGDAISAIGRGMFGGKKKNRARRANMALLSGNAWARPVFADRTLPAMTAGGFDYVYEAPVRTSIPSQAQGLRVPLASRKYKVETFYEATPSLAQTAYLKALVRNGSQLPILAGPANIFVKGAFSGDAQLQTTGPGGALELPLGADEDIRLTHTVIPTTKTEGLIFTDEITEYLVTIEIGNYKKRPVTVRVIDQLPKTNNEKIEVKFLSAKPRAKKKPDADGLLYWHVDVAAGKTQKVHFRYSIKRPKDWRLYQ